ncbi:hypothetical protein RHSIM_Rhsim07G0252200 [Rhododendron simsii]|uniref:Uncharacterized protein n=1 Tax=Rhododendron simsii TaxID=118357 RepID=A0A834GTY7_RHOSS|nr:hypothetical protein RHSIM_Rhsim07G0252200 [Rhododendron simsii]
MILILMNLNLDVETNHNLSFWCYFQSSTAKGYVGLQTGASTDSQNQIDSDQFSDEEKEDVVARDKDSGLEKIAELQAQSTINQGFFRSIRIGCKEYQDSKTQTAALPILNEIEEFLSSNPFEILALILEDCVEASNGLTKVFKAARLTKYLLPLEKMSRNGGDWPISQGHGYTYT